MLNDNSKEKHDYDKENNTCHFCILFVLGTKTKVVKKSL